MYVIMVYDVFKGNFQQKRRIRNTVGLLISILDYTGWS